MSDILLGITEWSIGRGILAATTDPGNILKYFSSGMRGFRKLFYPTQRNGGNARDPRNIRTASPLD